MFSLVTKSEKDTVGFGKRLAKILKAGDIVCLEGELGSGKTTLVKGIVAGLGVDRSSVHSPTFVLMNVYEGKLPVYHFDLYRLDDLKQIRTIDCEEYFYGDGVSLIEWADKLKELAPKEFIRIRLAHQSPQERRLDVDAVGIRYGHLLQKIKGFS